MGVIYLDVKPFDDFAKGLMTAIEDFNDVRADFTQSTDALLINWHGKAKTEFEKDYNSIFRQLEDVNDVMYDLYNSVVDAGAEYTRVDIETAKMMSISDV